MLWPCWYTPSPNSIHCNGCLVGFQFTNQIPPPGSACAVSKTHQAHSHLRTFTCAMTISPSSFLPQDLCTCCSPRQPLSISVSSFTSCFTVTSLENSSQITTKEAIILFHLLTQFCCFSPVIPLELFSFFFFFNAYNYLFLYLLLAVLSLCCSVQASVVAAHGLSCPMARGIFLDQVWNPGPLHWKHRVLAHVPWNPQPIGHPSSLQPVSPGSLAAPSQNHPLAMQPPTTAPSP